MHTDASVALGIAQRRGLGKVRHIQTQALWIQQAHSDTIIGYCKIPGTDNPSDVLPKHVPSDFLDRHSATMSLKFEGGRASKAPGINSLDVCDNHDCGVNRVRTFFTIHNSRTQNQAAVLPVPNVPPNLDNYAGAAVAPSVACEAFPPQIA